MSLIADATRLWVEGLWVEGRGGCGSMGCGSKVEGCGSRGL